MIKIYDEKLFLQNVSLGSSFRPQNIAFIIIHKGSIELELNGQSKIYCDGSIIFITPNYIYKILSFTEDLKIFILSVYNKEIRQKLKFSFNRYDIYRVANSENGNIIKLLPQEFDNIIDLSNNIKYYQSENCKSLFKEEITLSLFSAIIYVISGAILENIEDFSSKTNSRKEEITMQFVELVSVNYKEQKELKYYADRLLVPIKYLSNCVRDVTGFPPTKFIAETLINEAKILLLNKDQLIYSISAELGFSDQYSFGKFFKKHTSYSPRNFRITNQLVSTI